MNDTVASDQTFIEFARQFRAQFDSMSDHELYRVNIHGQALWDNYLAAFPPFTNPLFRKRTVHDGAFDRNAIRNVGNVIAIIDNKIVSIWDIEPPYPYNEVCKKLADMVHAASLEELFRVKETLYGRESSKETLEGGGIHTWYHLNAPISRRHQTAVVGANIGAFNSIVQVFSRGLKEITASAVNEVLELMENGTLYRGDEFQDAMRKFKVLRDAFGAITSQEEQTIFIYSKATSEPHSVTTIRNSVIGTLLTDLSEGMEVERAQSSYEQKVAPGNFNRPTARITPRMVEEAQKKIDSLGLEGALQRRFATLKDVDVNNVLWVNRSAQAQMKGGLAGMIGDLPQAAPSSKSVSNVTIADFMGTILRNAVVVDVLFRNSHEGNLVSITTAQNEGEPRLFKWDNAFAWSYRGNVADSIKEKVKKAGGNVAAKLRVSLAWYNFDDLDLHVECPDGHVFYGAPSGRSYRYSANILDVDMNAGRGTTRSAVENLSWTDPRDGEYRVWVNQFAAREDIDLGFSIEVENGGRLSHFTYTKRVKGDVPAFTFNMKKGVLSDLKPASDLEGEGRSTTRWGLNTETYVPVNTIMFSPNYWDGNAVGNKHWFFILQGCINDEEPRGFYNEYLRPELYEHKKVFEVVGGKTKCKQTPEQLSGLGFSSTKREALMVRVVSTDGSTRHYEIQF